MPRPRSPATDAAHALVAVAPLVTRWIERLLGGTDPPLTVPQYLALRSIAREQVSGSELARRTGVSEPAVSQLLAGLAGGGLIERSPAADDRRRLELTLSDAGRDVLDAAESTLRARVSTLLADLPRPESDALSRALPQVEALLAGTEPPRRPSPPPRPPHHERRR